MHTCTRGAHGCTRAHACTHVHRGTQAGWQSRASAEQHRGQQRERQRPRWLHTDPNLLCLGLIWANAEHRARVPAAPAPRAQQPRHHLDALCEGPALTRRPQRPCWQGPRRRGQSGHSPTSRSPPACQHRAPPAVRLAPGTASIRHWCWSSRLCRGRHCVPDFPFFRLIAPVAAEPGVKHLIFYSRIELENTINISLQLKDPSQPGTRSRPAGGIGPLPGRLCCLQPSGRGGPGKQVLLVSPLQAGR